MPSWGFPGGDPLALAPSRASFQESGEQIKPAILKYLTRNFQLLRSVLIVR